MGLINKPPKGMGTKAFLKKANELADSVIAAMGALTAKLREFKPQIEELRRDFRKLKGNQEIAGCKTWKHFCKEKLHRTDSAVRKLLAAAGKGKQKPAGEIPAPTSDELKSKALKAIREYTRASPDNTAGNLLGDLYPDAEATPPPSPIPAPDLASKNLSNLAAAYTTQVRPSSRAVVTEHKDTKALTAEAFQDCALTHFHGKSKVQVLKELASIWSALFPNEAPLALHSNGFQPKQQKTPSVGERNSAVQIGDVQ